MRDPGLLPDLDRELGTLKDFQRQTVDYVFQRLYLDDPPAHRFLVADEVGLGKTLVARGLIARTLHHLYDHDDVDRIDVVYVCSNADIAHQNLNRLNVTGRHDVVYPTRLTLLPTQVDDLESRRINFVSLTPGTSLETKSRGGRKRERVLLYHILSDVEELDVRGLRNLLQGTVERPNWHKYIEDLVPTYDEAIAADFSDALRTSADLMSELQSAVSAFREFWQTDLVGASETDRRYSVIGRLRNLLARVCIEALEPDLIILDEFQRFRDLLDGDTEAADLTRRLLNYQEDSGYRARVLLLSATPYTMLSYQDEEEDHHEDFLRTCKFLFEDDEHRTADLRGRLRDYRRALFRFGVDSEGSEATRDALSDARDRVQSNLLSVMVRTERTDAAGHRADDMLKEELLDAQLEPSDLHHARAVDRLARAVEAPGMVEYWKSAPYLPNLMHGYAFKEELVDRLPRAEPDVVSALERSRDVGALLDRDRIAEWEDIDPANGRLRNLLDDTVGEGMWRLLWMPPSLPYLEPSGPFAGADHVTKGLVFSSWRVVPQAISALCSYAAERSMLSQDPGRPPYDELHKGATRPIEFTIKDGRPSGMNPMMLLYPSPTLARLGDPLELALEFGGPLSHERVLRVVEERIREELRSAEIDVVYEGRGAVADQSWYRVALARLDRAHHPEMERWVKRKGGWKRATRDQVGEGFEAHLQEFAEGYDRDLSLGHAPGDLPRVLAELALASPAVCSLRALRRVSNVSEPANRDLLAAAVAVGLGFRSLYNAPDVVGLFRGREGPEELPYWRDVLHYGLEGNLQAVLDEQGHVLRDALGLMDREGPSAAKAIGEQLAAVLGLSAGHIHVDEFVRGSELSDASITTDRFQIRTRFALQFGRIQDDRGQTVARRGGVRDAFNSPFRPFVMATTSVGQEGLDFHSWCHAVYHWNLPSNPVDLEQREGRIHRYKGHAIRKNIARRFGLGGLDGMERENRSADTWTRLFERAEATREPDSSDLVPYWLFDGRARVERRVPLPPFSREVQRLRHLKKGLALYRMVFGQPRQEDLLEYLEEHAGHVDPEELLRYRISLAPPEVEIEQEPADGPMASDSSEELRSGQVGSSRDMAEALLSLVHRFDAEYELRRTSHYYGLEKDGSVDNFVVMRAREYGVRLEAKIEEDDPVVSELVEAGFELYPYRPDRADPGILPMEVRPGQLVRHEDLLARVLASAHRAASRFG